MNHRWLILFIGALLLSACQQATPQASVPAIMYPLSSELVKPKPSAVPAAPKPKPVAKKTTVPKAMPESFVQGRDLGKRDASQGLEKDPYRYRSQIDSKDWSDFVDGYLEGFARSKTR